jgi:epoxyqueuosine reductase
VTGAALAARAKGLAREEGFDLAGVARADAPPDLGFIAEWVARGFAGEMAYLTSQVAKRSDLRAAFPWARSVLCVGLQYDTKHPYSTSASPDRGWISRYAWGDDYHDVMKAMLDRLAARLREEAGPFEGRAYVDTGPILERDFAAQAGLGFVGKNTLLINPTIGSYLFLGEILVDMELEYDEPAPDGGAICQIGSPGESKRLGTCGACTRCLTVCPTHAFPAPYILDSNRCISYLTIELKDSIPPELRPLLGNWIFGCDECQEICPWVRRYSQPNRESFLRYNPEQAVPKLIDLMRLDEAGFRARFKGTPMFRPKRRGLLRNVAVALGNWGSPEALPVLEQALQDPEPLVREHAGWAIEKIGTG